MNETINRPVGCRIKEKADCDKCGFPCKIKDGWDAGRDAYFLGFHGESLCISCAKKLFII